MEVNLVVEGLKFMVIGMGTVFVFLILMIIALNIQAKILSRFFPDAPQKNEVPMASTHSSVNKVAAIVGAIMQHHQAK